MWQGFLGKKLDATRQEKVSIPSSCKAQELKKQRTKGKRTNAHVPEFCANKPRAFFLHAGKKNPA